MPILVLSARSEETQKVRALDLGADDYLTKPFTMGDLTVDYAKRLAFKQGQELKLTPHEYEILRFLTQNAERVLTHRQDLVAVWGPEDAEETQYLRVHVSHLRQKIEDNPAHPRLIVTEPGVGYRFRTIEPPGE